MTLLTLYLITGYVAAGFLKALFGIWRGTNPYWHVQGTDALRLTAQEMVIWGFELLALLVVDVLSRRQARMEVRL